MDLIGLLVTLLILALVIWLVIYIVNIIPIPPPFKSVVLAIMGVIFLIYLIGILFGQASLPFYFHRP